MHDHQNLTPFRRFSPAITESSKVNLSCCVLFSQKREKIAYNHLTRLTWLSFSVGLRLFFSLFQFTTIKPVSIVQVITEIVLNLSFQKCLHRVDSSRSFGLIDCWRHNRQQSSSIEGNEKPISSSIFVLQSPVSKAVTCPQFLFLHLPITDWIRPFLFNGSRNFHN